MKAQIYAKVSFFALWRLDKLANLFKQFVICDVSEYCMYCIVFYHLLITISSQQQHISNDQTNC